MYVRRSIVLVEIKVWRDGRHIVVRNDAFHINTFGKSLEEALKNFHEALTLALENRKETKAKHVSFVLPYPIENKSIKSSAVKAV